MKSKVNQVSKARLFDETKYVLWNSRMWFFFMGIGFEVWESIVTRRTTTKESKEYNTKAMKKILSILSDYVKIKVGQCSSVKNIWEKLKNKIYRI